MAEGRISVERVDHVACLTLDNPRRLNAVSQLMWDQIAVEMARCDRDDGVRVVILQGAGTKAFAAGADISKFESERADAERIRDYERSVNRAYAAVQYAHKPTIAKVRGYCFGGGMGLASCCDIRICSEEASFCIPAAKLGVGYGHNNTRVLMDLIGPAFAKEILYSGEPLDAARAARIGLVNHVVMADALDDFVAAFVDRLVRNAPLSLRASNLIVSELLKDEPDYDLCVRLSEDCAASRDIHEGRRAFVEKRPPEFKGH